MSFYLDVITNDPRFLSPKRCADLTLLEPLFRQRVEAILARSAAAGMPLLVFETYRSRERQALLYGQHATKLSTVGVHHYGLACDLVKDIDGFSWKGSFAFLGVLAAEQGLVWGGDWGSPSTAHTFIDADHVQRIALRDQAKLFSGKWYPGDDYGVRVIT
jgi:hypothetical protein